MNRAAYLAILSAIGGVSLANLFKLVAILSVMAGGLFGDLKGPWSSTFERSASVVELTQEAKFFADLFGPPGDRQGNVRPIRDSSVWPTPDKIQAVLAAEACYRLPAVQVNMQVSDTTCSPEQLRRVEYLVRVWAFFSLALLTLLGVIGLVATVRWQHRLPGSEFGPPRSSDAFKTVFEKAIEEANLKQSDDKEIYEEKLNREKLTKPKYIADLTSGKYIFEKPSPEQHKNEIGLFFWLFNAIIVSVCFLFVLDRGFVVTLLIIGTGILILDRWRFVYEKEPWSWFFQNFSRAPRPNKQRYRLVYDHVVQERAGSSDATVVHPIDPATEITVTGELNSARKSACEDELSKARSELQDAERKVATIERNVEQFHAFLKYSLDKVSAERKAAGELKLAGFIFGALALLVFGNLAGAWLINQIHGLVFPGVDWSPSDGLTPPHDLWAVLGRVFEKSSLIGRIIVWTFVSLLFLSIVLTLAADLFKRIWLKIVAIITSLLFFFYAASLMTWLAGLPQSRSEQPVILVRGGLVCQVPSKAIIGPGETRKVGSATWAFGDDGRAAFDLNTNPDEPDACTLDDQMRYPEMTLSELTRGTGQAQLAIVVGLASFEGQDGAEAELAQSRAETLARELESLTVISVFLGRHQVPPTAAGVEPAQSASQRKVLVYLAGRRGSAARRDPLTLNEEETLLRSVREDLMDAHRTDPNDYDVKGCKVQRQDSEGIFRPDPQLTAVFCPAAVVPTVVQNGVGAPGR